jgi:hypothetical protein
MKSYRSVGNIGPTGQAITCATLKRAQRVLSQAPSARPRSVATGRGDLLDAPVKNKTDQMIWSVPLLAYREQSGHMQTPKSQPPDFKDPFPDGNEVFDTTTSGHVAP